MRPEKSFPQTHENKLCAHAPTHLSQVEKKKNNNNTESIAFLTTVSSHRHMAQAPGAHLCEVEVHEAEREELQADGEAVEQPEGEGSECVGGHTVSEVEGEEEGAQGGPQQTQEQEGRLVAEALVSVSQHQPELGVDEGEEQRVEDGVGDGQTQLHVGWDGRRDGGRGREVGAVTGMLLLLCQVPLHRLPIHPPCVPQEREGGRVA